MRVWLGGVFLAGGVSLLATAAIGQGGQAPTSTPPPNPRATGTPAQREQATHEFLGLGVVPDKEAAARGEPLYQRNCSFCHGPAARGAEGPSLVVSDEVLADDHGEKLVPFLKKGRPDKGMPSFAAVSDADLKDITEFLHLQVENIANRGTYKIPHVITGDPVKGKAYVAANCLSCHTDATFAKIGSKFRSGDLLQRGWVWPARPADHSMDVTATVRTADGVTVSGRVTLVSDFKISIVDADGKAQTIARGPGVSVTLKDPLAPHQALIMTLKNDDMRNVTAYLDTLK